MSFCARGNGVGIVISSVFDASVAKARDRFADVIEPLEEAYGHEFYPSVLYAFHRLRSKFERTRQEPRGFILRMDKGLGKTFTGTLLIAARQAASVAATVHLVVAPKAVLDGQWRRVIQKLLPEHNIRNFDRGNGKTSALEDFDDYLNGLPNLLKGGQGITLLLTPGQMTRWFLEDEQQAVRAAKFAKHVDQVFVDELELYKSPKSKRHHAMASLCTAFRESHERRHRQEYPLIVFLGADLATISGREYHAIVSLTEPSKARLDQIAKGQAILEKRAVAEASELSAAEKAELQKPLHYPRYVVSVSARSPEIARSLPCKEADFQPVQLVHADDAATKSSARMEKYYDRTLQVVAKSDKLMIEERRPRQTTPAHVDICVFNPGCRHQQLQHQRQKNFVTDESTVETVVDLCRAKMQAVKDNGGYFRGVLFVRHVESGDKLYSELRERLPEETVVVFLRNSRVAERTTDGVQAAQVISALAAKLVTICCSARSRAGSGLPGHHSNFLSRRSCHRRRFPSPGRFGSYSTRCLRVSRLKDMT